MVEKEIEVVSCNSDEIGKQPVVEGYGRKDTALYNKQINSSSMLDDLLMSSYHSQIPNTSLPVSRSRLLSTNLLKSKADDMQNNGIKSSIVR